MIRRAWLAALLVLVAGLLPAATASGATLPAGFVDDEVLEGLDLPTAIRFAADGRVFVAEKSGLVKVFDGLDDETPVVFADLRLQVHDYFDRGLLGLELDPDFPDEPYVYVLYTHDAAIGGTAPRWGTAKGGDDCPNPPGFANGCVVSGRLSRLEADGSKATGSERVLVEDWCQQYWGHSIGALGFDAGGALYASGGDGAWAGAPDYGQRGSPLNPCGDPPGGVGAKLSPPSAEGGSLRSQDLRSGGDPLGLDGTVIRVDPETGAGLPDNPLGGSADENARRVVAFGFRNPFRFALRPGTDELWVGDVGLDAWEEIDRFEVPGAGPQPANAGWPCYEGPGQQPAFASLSLSLCSSLYALPLATGPHFAYPSKAPVTAGEDCTLQNGSAISGLAFYGEGGFPEEYDGALFFGDYARNCIWVMPSGAGGEPDPGQVSVFEEGAGSAVDLQTGPGGDLFYADIAGGSVHRISFFGGNRPPNALLKASPTDGPLPLVTQLDASGSSDPDGDPLEFDWDYDEDGEFDDAEGEKPAPLAFAAKEDRKIKVRVGDGEFDDTAAVTIHAGNSRPTATILAPDPDLEWEAGDSIEVEGEGIDPDDGEVPVTWSVVLEHCPDACHEHFVTELSTAEGLVIGPEHEYPAHLTLRLTAEDSGGLEASDEIELHPRTAEVDVRSKPAGVPLTLGATVETAPFSREVIRGSLVQLSAPAEADVKGAPASFLRWNDGLMDFKELVHPFQADSDETLTAVYDWSPPAGPGLGPCRDGTPPQSVLRRSGIHLWKRGVVVQGTVGDLGCPGPAQPGSSPGRAFVYLALRQGKRCRFLAAGRPQAPRRCGRPQLLPARGFARFSRRVRAELPPGRYLAGSLAVDEAGNRERPGAQNRVWFRLRRPAG